MREVKDAPTTFETPEWRIDLQNMKAWHNSHIGAGMYDIMRGLPYCRGRTKPVVLPDCQFVPYFVPKNDRSHSYLKDTEFVDVRI
jgi:hypothetical protein